MQLSASLRCTVLTWHYNLSLLLLTNAYNSLSRRSACFVFLTETRTAVLRHESQEQTGTEGRLVHQLNRFLVLRPLC